MVDEKEKVRMRGYGRALVVKSELVLLQLKGIFVCSCFGRYDKKIFKGIYSNIK